MSKQDWTDRLPDLFEGYTEAEPEGLWDAVQGAMAPKQKKAAAWWWYGAAALAAAACVAVGVFLFRDDSSVIHSSVISSDPTVISSDPTVISSEVEKSLVADATVIPSDPSVIPSDPSVIPSDPTVIPSDPTVIPSESEESVTDMGTSTDARSESGMTETVSGSKNKEKKTNNVTETIEETIEDPIEDDIPDPSCPAATGHLETDDKENNGAVEGETDARSASDMTESVPATNQRPRKPTEVRLRAGASSGQYLAQDVTRTTTGYGLPAAYPGMPVTRAATGTASGSLTPMMLSRNKPSTTEAVHHRASRFGLTFGATIGRRWEVESGIYLTTLKSSYASESGTARSTTEREMDYIGFPLHAQYKIWWYRGLSVYGFAGPMFETSWRTRTTTVQTLGDNRTTTTDRTNIRDNRWSLQAGAGAQLEFLPGACLFLQPSLSWHIPNGNGLENAYSEHPFSPELFFGVRFTFDR